MQVDPIKTTLKAPGTERLKLKYEELLSNFGFKFNLRRYTKDKAEPATKYPATLLKPSFLGDGRRLLVTKVSGLFCLSSLCCTLRYNLSSSPPPFSN